jgi:hypothetical protein
LPSATWFSTATVFPTAGGVDPHGIQAHRPEVPPDLFKIIALTQQNTVFSLFFLILASTNIMKKHYKSLCIPSSRKKPDSDFTEDKPCLRNYW